MIVFLHNFVHTNKKWFQLHIFDKSRKKIKEASSNKNNKGCTIHIWYSFSSFNYNANFNTYYFKPHIFNSQLVHNHTIVLLRLVYIKLKMFGFLLTSSKTHQLKIRMRNNAKPNFFVFFFFSVKKLNILLILLRLFLKNIYVMHLRTMDLKLNGHFDRS